MSISVDSPHDNLEALRMTDDDDWDDEAFGDVEPTRVMGSFEDGFFFGDRFKIDKILGTGGMGTVYEAIDMTSHQRIALKILKKKKNASEEGEARFRREAEILATIHHPGIVGIHGFGAAADGTLWLAMEYLDGLTLRQKVERDGPMDPVELGPIIQAACDALTATHDRGIVHRDLKPDNIFLTSTNPPSVKILDFGLSLSLASKKLTATGTMIGTPRYMSPEQIKSAHAAGAQADVYALGVIAYEVLTGQSPFAASDHGQLLGAILTGKKQPLHDFRPDFPEALEACLHRAMAPNIEDRYQTPIEFAAAFADAVSIHETLRATPAPPTMPGRPTLRTLETPARFSVPIPIEVPCDQTPTRGAPPTRQSPLTRVTPLDLARKDLPLLPKDGEPVPRWMIPFVVLGGVAIMGVGAALAYWLMR